jgi:ABC-type uncharacterized transport system permease subunit
MDKTHRYRPIIYFALAFAITWINGFFLAVQSHQSGDKSIINLLLAYMGPFIAALIVMCVFADKTFRSDFRKRIYDLRSINKNYLPFVLFFLPLAMVISIGSSLFCVGGFKRSRIQWLGRNNFVIAGIRTVMK